MMLAMLRSQDMEVLRITSTAVAYSPKHQSRPIGVAVGAANARMGEKFCE
jgi:hypothetical protein